jgi:hypothetical protein
LFIFSSFKKIRKKKKKMKKMTIEKNFIVENDKIIEIKFNRFWIDLLNSKK